MSNEKNESSEKENNIQIKSPNEQKNTDKVSDSTNFSENNSESDSNEQEIDENSEIKENSETNKENSENEQEKSGGFVTDLLSKLLSVGEDGLNKAKDLSVPKEMLNYGKEQISVFRKEITSIAGKELNQFFKSINIGKEIAKILTYLTFEIKMQIRLVPSEKNGLKPETKIRVKKVDSEEKDQE